MIMLKIGADLNFHEWGRQYHAEVNFTVSFRDKLNGNEVGQS